MNTIKKYKDLILSIMMVIMVTFITVGYATFYKDLGFNGAVTLKKVGKVQVIRVDLDSSASPNTLSKYGTLDVDGEGNMSLNYNFSIKRQDSTDYTSTYLVYVDNPTPFDYTFTGLAISPDINITKGSSDDTSAAVKFIIDTNNRQNQINIGDTIKAYETKIVAIKLTITLSTNNSSGAEIGVSGEGTSSTILDNTGDMTGNVKTTNLDLRNHKARDCFDVEVMNTFSYARNFNLSSSNTNFKLVDSNGNPLPTFDIGAPSETNSESNVQTYNVCLQESEGAVFLKESASTDIILSSSGIVDKNLGSINVAVDLSAAADDGIPEVGNVKMTVGTYNQSDGSLPVNISWDRLDSGGTNITNYYIMVYDENNGECVAYPGTTTCLKFDTGSAVTSYNVALTSAHLASNDNNINVDNHNFYAIVYGKDEAGNSGAGDGSKGGTNYCQTGTTNRYCVKSPGVSFKWKYNVTTNFTRMSLASGTPTNAYLSNTYTATFTADNNYELPSEITVTMGGTKLVSGTDYTYSSAARTNHLVITKPVTGDIVISGQATYNGGGCLVKGTKVKTAKGLKNVEDVGYDDLIATFSYDLGKEVYVYPIWIKEPTESNYYQRATFSDGTILETVNDHGIFSKDLNKYVSVLDRDNFHIGTNVVKIENGNISTVSVINIETIYEDTYYYHVEATHYLNTIANDFLTADGFTDLSNMYTFNNDLTWSSERINNLTNGDLFVYNDLSLFFPEYLFNGLRLEEAKFLVLNGTIDVNKYVNTLGSAGVKEVPKNSYGKNIWMVITSDELNNNGTGSYYEEGSYYTLPNPIKKEDKKFIGWYSTSDNIYYQIGDKVKVKYGMYFEAIWE